MIDKGFFLVAVHGGAGYHSDDSELEIKRAMRLACKKSLEVLQTSSGALNAVESAITVLEDDPCLNAGYGSNLTLDGTVECDASLIDGRTGDFGSVGAVPGVKNPISAARAVLDYARLPDPLGRIPPTLLVSQGANAFAQAKAVHCLPPDTLVSPHALRDWKLWKDRLTSSEPQRSIDSPDTPHDPSPSLPHESGSYTNNKRLCDVQDTVGAIVWDPSGNLAAGVSSGGLLLKFPGRVGEAAIWGAGCWAQCSSREKATGVSRVACSVSGSGEYIVREMLAKSVCETVIQSSEADTHDVLFQTLLQFHKNARARGEIEPIAGILLLVGENDGEGEVHPRLWCAFTTHSMAIAYVSSTDHKPKAMLLRRPTPRTEDSSSQIYITALSLAR